MWNPVQADREQSRTGAVSFDGLRRPRRARQIVGRTFGVIIAQIGVI